MTVGVVLGAGGSLGWAFHLGVIDGIRDVTGRALTDVSKVVGTSAGGAIGASVLAGADAEEILGSISAPLTPEQQEEMAAARSRGGRRRWPLRLLRPQSPKMLRRGGFVGLVGLAPAGVFPTYPIRRFPTHSLTDWPDQLWIPSVRLGDGAVVVFGRDRRDVPVPDAVEATSAVPVLFQPKRIGDRRFIDGAVASATHAHLLADHGLDLVIVSSPMTRPGRGPVKLRARRQLKAEVSTLTRNGTRVVVVEPDEAIMTVADGFPRQNPERGSDIIDAARAMTVEALQQNH
ncbi:MAG: patatin-like phospholipase family protein [Actinomycetota bacterium]